MSSQSPRLPAPPLLSLPGLQHRLRSLFSRSRRRKILKTLMKSHRITLNRVQHLELPLRIRPWFVGLTALVLIVLGILGLHPTAGGHVPLPDKVVHFIGFGVATICTFFIWDVDESARRIWWWRWSATILTGFTCLVVGGVFSEVVQGLLPYKVFQWGDIVANELGASLGLVTARHLDRKYRDARELSELYLPVSVSDDALASSVDGTDVSDAESDLEAHRQSRGSGAPGVAKPGKGGYHVAKGRKGRLADVWDAEIAGEELFSLGDADLDDDAAERERTPTLRDSATLPKTSGPSLGSAAVGGAEWRDAGS